MEADPTVWVARIESGNADSIHALRGLPEVEIAEHADEIWIRGFGDPPPELSGVRFQSIQQLLAENQLAPLDSRVPTETLPDLNWREISTLTKPQSPPSALPAKLDSTCPIQLVRTAEFAEPGLILTELETFANWVSQAPRIRLYPLRFACSDRREVLVHGSPIPSISGQRFVVSAESIACPAGSTWDSPVPAAVLIKMLGLAPGDLAVFRDETVDVIPKSNFVPVTRAAVRLTKENHA